MVCAGGVEAATAAFSARLLLILNSMLMGSREGRAGLAAFPRWTFITDCSALRGLTNGCSGGGWSVMIAVLPHREAGKGDATALDSTPFSIDSFMEMSPFESL